MIVVAVAILSVTTRIERDGRLPVHAAFIPDDEYWGSQWALGVIDAARAWDTSVGSHAIRIAVVDSGIVPHPDLEGNICGSTNLVDPDGLHAHGTWVAGIIAATANNAVGIAGVAKACLLDIRILDVDGAASWDSVLAGLNAAMALDADIVVMSFGGYDPPEELAELLDNMDSQGRILVAAAGNTGCPPGDGRAFFPASHPAVIAVGAARLEAPFGVVPDSRSACGLAVDVYAPGAAIWTTDPSGFVAVSGTSFAAPHVAGIAALMLDERPTLRPAEVRCIIAHEAQAFGPPPWLPLPHGVVNASSALRAPIGGIGCAG